MKECYLIAINSIIVKCWVAVELDSKRLVLLWGLADRIPSLDDKYPFWLSCGGPYTPMKAWKSDGAETDKFMFAVAEGRLKSADGNEERFWEYATEEMIKIPFDSLREFEEKAQLAGVELQQISHDYFRNWFDVHRNGDVEMACELFASNGLSENYRLLVPSPDEEEVCGD